MRRVIKTELKDGNLLIKNVGSLIDNGITYVSNKEKVKGIPKSICKNKYYATTVEMIVDNIVSYIARCEKLFKKYEVDTISELPEELHYGRGIVAILINPDRNNLTRVERIKDYFDRCNVQVIIGLEGN